MYVGIYIELKIFAGLVINYTKSWKSTKSKTTQ